MTFSPREVLDLLSLPKTRAARLLRFRFKMMAPPTGIEPVAHCLEGTVRSASLNLSIGRNMSKNAQIEPSLQVLPHQIPHLGEHNEQETTSQDI